MQSFLQWWREGERAEKSVYRQSFYAPVSVVVGGVALFSLVPRFRTWYAVLIFAYVAGMALIECRRAIILTDSNLIYRPAFGRLLRVELAQIGSVERCTAPVPSLAALRPRLSKGLRFRLKGGEEVVVPIDFPHSREISQQFLISSGTSLPKS
jgi:hypothetical protein